MGKGSQARPFSVSRSEFNSNYDQIFRKNSNENSNTIPGQDQWRHSNDPGLGPTTSTVGGKPSATTANDS
jgi:hypothetical protein